MHMALHPVSFLTPIITIADELMVTLLDSKQVELVYSSCGVLINLLADPLHRGVLHQTSGVRKLVPT